MERAQLVRWLEVAAVVVPPPFAGQGTARASGGTVIQHLRRRRGLGTAGVPVPAQADPVTRRRRHAGRAVPERLAGGGELQRGVESTRALVEARTGVPVFQGWRICTARRTAAGVDGYILAARQPGPGLAGRCAWKCRPRAPALQEEMLSTARPMTCWARRWRLGLKRELSGRGTIAGSHAARPIPETVVRPALMPQPGPRPPGARRGGTCR